MPSIDTYPENSVFRLVRELKDDLSDLVRKEIALAKREAAAKAKDLGRSAALFGAAAAVGLFALFYFCLFLDHLLMAGLVALGLSAMLSAWLAPLLVGCLLGIAGLLTALAGLRSMRHADPKPGSWRTLRSLRAIGAEDLRGKREARPAGAGAAGKG